MTWTCSVSIDPDKDRVGIATAIFADATRGEFVYSRRIDGALSGDRAAFVGEAKSALTAWQTRRDREATAGSALTTALNT